MTFHLSPLTFVGYIKINHDYIIIIIINTVILVLSSSLHTIQNTNMHSKIPICMHSVFRKGSHFVVVHKFVYACIHRYAHSSSSSFIVFFLLFFCLQAPNERPQSERGRKKKTSCYLMNIHTCRLSVINSKIGWSAQLPICVCVYYTSLYICMYVYIQHIE